MRCPKCHKDNDRVVDSRTAPDGFAIRRRRECLLCNARFTTYERIEHVFPRVLKRSGGVEPFDRLKIERGILSACQKRNIPSQEIDQLIDDLLVTLEQTKGAEVESSYIGQLIMERLRTLDPVAYVRFASVYAAFDDVQQFIDTVNAMAPKKKTRQTQRKKRTPSA
jgi:transcriptional repressor NrdR